MSEEAQSSLSVESESAHQAEVETQQQAQAEATSWYSGIQDAELRSYVEKTGYKSMDDVVSAARSGRQLISKVQGDPDRVLMMPKDWEDEAQVAEFYGKLGRPETPDGYQFVDQDGNTIEQDAVVDWFRDAAYRTGLPGEKASAMLNEFRGMAAELQQQQEAQAEEAWQQGFERDMADLRKEWGNGYDEKIAISRAALQQFPELGSAELERTLGAKAYYQLVSNIGERIGEHKVVSGGGRNESFGRTPQQAQAALQELQASKEWQEAFFDSGHIGHAAALAKRDALMRDAYPS